MNHMLITGAAGSPCVHLGALYDFKLQRSFGALYDFKLQMSFGVRLQVVSGQMTNHMLITGAAGFPCVHLGALYDLQTSQELCWRSPTSSFRTDDGSHVD